LDAIREAIAALQQETATYSDGVHTWMNIMMVMFLSSLAFLPKKGARWILAAALVNGAGLILIKTLAPHLSRETIGTAVHLTFWTLALAMIWRPALRRARRAAPRTMYHRLYSVWLVAASLVMAVSLLLDARTALGWLG